MVRGADPLPDQAACFARAERRWLKELFDLTANPWTVLTTDFPATETPDQQLRFLLNYAVLAPSEANTQSWLFKVGGRNVAIYADRGIVNLFPFIDEFSPRRDLFR